MRISSIHIALGLILLSTSAFPQENTNFSTEKVLECIAESYTGELEDEADLTNILDELQGFIESPLNINSASREEFEKLIILNDRQIETLIAYRGKMGQIYSLEELLTLDGFNEKVVDDLSVFISFRPPENISRKYFRNELSLQSQYTFEKASGFISDEKGEKKFSGLRPKLLLKYSAEKDGRFDLGITAENDAGETFFAGSNNTGFDFYSGFIGWKGDKIVKKVYLGDFRIKTGQGLIFGSGYGGRKSAETTNIRSSGQGIKPSSSTTEYGFFRGLATQLGMNNFDIIAFYSNKNSDANITLTDGNDNTNVVSSLQTSGYHRTESEISDKNSINVQTAGLGVKFIRSNFSASLNGCYQKYNVPIEPTPKLYNQYYFRGKENYNIGADYLWMLNPINLFGEVAFCKSGGYAIVSGLEANPSSEVGFSILYRDYKKDFHPINGNSFSEFGSVSNERGIYSGITFYAIPKMTISSYLDIYESYWVKFNSIRPVKGHDFLFQSEYSFSHDIALSLRFKTESRNENSSLISNIKNDVVIQSNHVRLNVEWKPSGNCNIRLRTEWSGIENEDSLNQGWLILSDVSIRSANEKFSATTRLAWFNTENYDSRIYAYENDIPSSFNIPAYYSTGWRYYLNLKYKICDKLSLYLKLSQTRYSNGTGSIGSGDSQINGNHKTEFKLQLRFIF